MKSYFLQDTGRAKYVYATDDEALKGFKLLSRLEGIIPALEPAHAIPRLVEIGKRGIVVLNLSGRGDRDMYQVMRFTLNSPSP